MKELEKLCQSNNMEKVVLTVLKGLIPSLSFLTHASFTLPAVNTKAIAFYKSVG